MALIDYVIIRTVTEKHHVLVEEEDGFEVLAMAAQGKIRMDDVTIIGVTSVKIEVVRCAACEEAQKNFKLCPVHTRK